MAFRRARRVDDIDPFTDLLDSKTFGEGDFLLIGYGGSGDQDIEGRLKRTVLAELVLASVETALALHLRPITKHGGIANNLVALEQLRDAGRRRRWRDNDLYFRTRRTRGVNLLLIPVQRSQDPARD